jgi:hypothetical protein
MMAWKMAISLTIVLLVSALPAACGTNEDAQAISVPIKMANARNVGGVGFELLYDSTILEAREVAKGSLASGANAQYNLDTPGRIVIVVTDAKGISGDGTLVKVLFKVLTTAGSTTLVPMNVDARDNDTSASLDTHVAQGSFSAQDGSVVAPVITFGP